MGRCRLEFSSVEERPVKRSCQHGNNFPGSKKCREYLDWQVKRQGKVRPGTGHERPKGKQRYSSTLSLTSALDGDGWLTPRPSSFTPEKETRYPLYRRLGGPQGRFGRMRKISTPPGFDSRTVEPVASRYTD